MPMKNTYLVNIEIDDKLTKEVLDRYVERALSKFYIHDPENSFDGCNQPKVKVLPVIQTEDISETLALLKRVKGYISVMRKLKGLE